MSIVGYGLEGIIDIFIWRWCVFVREGVIGDNDELKCV